VKRIGVIALSAAVALVYLVPIGWMVFGALTPGDRIFSGGLLGVLDVEHWTIANLAAIARRGEALAAFANSVLQVTAIAALDLLLSSMAAYALARIEIPGRGLLVGAIVALIILPLEALAVPLLLTVRDLGLVGGRVETLAALALPFSAKAFSVYLLRQHFLRIPRELEDAARIDGASWLRIYASIALPAIKPALATAALIDVLVHWSDFIWPLLVSTRNGTQTVQLELAALFTQPPVAWGEVLAASALATLPMALLFAALGRFFVVSDVRAGLR
jgi:multiple sugar transport system permease protein/fructooligosaccharide transport system permease protein